MTKYFCCLGLELNSAHNFRQVIEILHSKIIKAYMSLKENFDFYHVYWKNSMCNDQIIWING